MRIDRDDLEAAAKAGILTDKQAKQLFSFLSELHQDTPSFKLTHVLYYFGGFLAISAITLFVTQIWDTLIGFPLFLLSLLLFTLGLLLTHYFDNKHLRIPAGIMATFSLAVVPLAVYNLQIWLGYHPPVNYNYSDYHAYVNWFWMPMELSTLVVGAVLLYIYRYPFLVFPVAVTLWYMSMDLFPLLTHAKMYDWQDRALFSMYFGLVIIAAAIYMDLKHSTKRQDYAFWLYIFGVMTFWGGLSCQSSDSEISKFIYCMINVAMILVSVFLYRKVFAVFGAIGVIGYLGHLSFTVFTNSFTFPLALVFLGLLIIFAATRWARVEKKLTQYFLPYMPKAIVKRRQW